MKWLRGRGRHENTRTTVSKPKPKLCKGCSGTGEVTEWVNQKMGTTRSKKCPICKGKRTV